MKSRIIRIAGLSFGIAIAGTSLTACLGKTELGARKLNVGKVTFSDQFQRDPEHLKIKLAAGSGTTVVLNNEVSLEISGGVEPYTLAVVSGEGDVDSANRTYKAPRELEQIPSISVVEVKDSIGNQAILALTVGLSEGPKDPNDFRYRELWGMNNTAQTGGTADADIDAPEAWDYHHDCSSILVGVIDSGIDYSHPDLSGNIWSNPNEIAGNGIDDDNNGYIDDVQGWDFANNDNNPFDDNRHGTHVAGTIGAAGNNSADVVGVCWKASIVGMKFLAANGGGVLSDAIEAIDYAISIDAKILNNSWGGPGNPQGEGDPALRDAIQRANAAGILFVAAAGNGGQDGQGDDNDNANDRGYPASYDLPNIIAVAATDDDDQLASFSNYGATSVDLAAPGVSILSTIPGNRTASLNGTSMATPHVAGAAALLWSLYPELSMEQVKSRILDRVDPVVALDGKVLTGGRLNLFNLIDPNYRP